MLETMTAMQYREWLAFFKIRNERDAGSATQADETHMAGALSRALDGYQQRRDAMHRRQHD